MKCPALQRNALAALVLTALLTAGGCSKSPTAPKDEPIKILVAIAVAGGVGSYSASYNGQTYTRSGGFDIDAAPGTHEISGTYTGGTLIIGFATSPFSDREGGVQTSSVAAVAGTVSVLLPCGVAYSEGPGTRTFRVRFVVTRDANHIC